jgi:hypothetical protein
LTTKQSLNRLAGGGGGFRSTLYIILAVIVLASVYALAFVISDGSGPQISPPPRPAQARLPPAK